MRGQNVKAVVVFDRLEAEKLSREIGESQGYPCAAIRAKDGAPFPDAVAWLSGPRDTPAPPTVVFWARPEPSRNRKDAWAVIVPSESDAEVMSREFYDGDT